MHGRLTLFKQPHLYHTDNPPYLVFDMVEAPDFLQNLDKCFGDWSRDAKKGKIFLNSHDASILIAKFNNLETRDDLINLWNTYLIENVVLSRDHQVIQRMSRKLLIYIAEHFDQNGFFALLQTALWAYMSQDLELAMDFSFSRRTVNFIARKNRIEIEEVVEVMQVRDLNNPTKIISSKNGKDPLVRAKLRHHIDIDEKGEIKHTMDKVVMEFDSAETQALMEPKKVFDKVMSSRSLSEKIANYVNEKFFHQKPVLYQVHITPRVI